jgi:predicted phosphodiesterase
MSDLHFEMHRDHGKGFIDSLNSVGVDILVLAGDIAYESFHHTPIKMLCNKYKSVVMVAGNHDFYSSSFDKTRDVLCSLNDQISNFHFLDNDIIRLGGLRLVGCTMWFRDNPDNVLYQNALNDFNWVKDFGNHVYKENARSVKFLYDNLQENDIVVTHHMPSADCVHPSYRNGLNSSFNRFYYCEMKELILDRNPKYWFFGHTHQLVDVNIGSTKCVNNALGYPMEKTEFVDKMVFDV